MPLAPAAQSSPRIFDYEARNRALPELARQYRDNPPCPHILIKDFLDPKTVEEAARQFPTAASDAWTQYKHVNENKLGMPKRDLFPPALGALADELNSPEFVAWVSGLSGIPNLLADPMFDGGGLHQSGPGGYLNVHTDFSRHHTYTHWRRRINLILYLNPGWQESWGGALELWEPKMARCAVKYPPLLNHAMIFTTDDKSLHGFPDPLACPAGVTRKSLALYYYTDEKDADFTVRSTNYFARPQDSFGKSVMIWLDKKVLALYSWAKAKFGFSDAFASKILGFLSRKK
jgi:hypothetical protein